MNTPDLDAIQARADAASPGPWKADSEVRGDCVVWGPNGKFLMNQQAAPHWVDAPGDQKRAVSFDVDKRDGEFIANARTDVPALLAYARDLEARIGRVEALHQSSGGHNPACHCGVPAGSGANCIECGDVWPCPSITALTATEGQA